MSLHGQHLHFFRRVRELNSSNTKKFLEERKRVTITLTKSLGTISGYSFSLFFVENQALVNKQMLVLALFHILVV